MPNNTNNIKVEILDLVDFLDVEAWKRELDWSMYILFINDICLMKGLDFDKHGVFKKVRLLNSKPFFASRT